MLQKYRTVLLTSPKLSATSLGRARASTSRQEREAHRPAPGAPDAGPALRCSHRGSSGPFRKQLPSARLWGSPETAGAPPPLSLLCGPVDGKLASTSTVPLLRTWEQCLASTMPGKGFVGRAAHGEPVSATRRNQAALTARARGRGVRFRL